MNSVCNDVHRCVKTHAHSSQSLLFHVKSSVLGFLTGWMSGQRQTEAPPVWVCVCASDYLTVSVEINDALCLSSFPLCSRASNYSKLIGQIPVAGIISSPVCIHAIGWHYWAHPVLTERYGDAFNSWLKTLQFTSSCQPFQGGFPKNLAVAYVLRHTWVVYLPNLCLSPKIRPTGDLVPHCNLTSHSCRSCTTATTTMRVPCRFSNEHALRLRAETYTKHAWMCTAAFWKAPPIQVNYQFFKGVPF